MTKGARTMLLASLERGLCVSHPEICVPAIIGITFGVVETKGKTLGKMSRCPRLLELRMHASSKLA